MEERTGDLGQRVGDPKDRTGLAYTVAILRGTLEVSLGLVKSLEAAGVREVVLEPPPQEPPSRPVVRVIGGPITTDVAEPVSGSSS